MNNFEELFKTSNLDSKSRNFTSLDDFESIFGDGSVNFEVKSSSVPVYDKPVFDDESNSINYDDVFNLKGNNYESDDLLGGGAKFELSEKGSERRNGEFDDDNLGNFARGAKLEFGKKGLEVGKDEFDDVFGSLGGGAKWEFSKKVSVGRNGAFDDVLGSLGEGAKREFNEKGAEEFEDLIQGFDGGSGSSPRNGRETSEINWSPKTTAHAGNTTPNLMENPYEILELSSSLEDPVSGLFVDPLEEIGKMKKPGKARVDSSSVRAGVFDDLDLLDNLGKSEPDYSSEVTDRHEGSSPLETSSNPFIIQASANEGSSEEFSVKSPVSSHKVSQDSNCESYQNPFDMPMNSHDSHYSVSQNGYAPIYEDVSPIKMNSPLTPEENFKLPDDVWVTVFEIPLFTQPTTAPPPSRSPPPRPARALAAETSGLSSVNTREKVNEFPSFSNSAQYFQTSKSVRATARSSVVSPIDEPEDFFMASTQGNVAGNADVYPGEEVEAWSDAAASAAAMKDAMDRAEANFRHAKELTGREYARVARNRESWQQDDGDRSTQDCHDRAHRESKERLECEQQREKEEEEREWSRLEQERERAREIEREKEEKQREQRIYEKEMEKAKQIEREREMARQAVQRATREARERAAAEALLKAERVAVQRAQAEARERAAAEAKERAQKAAAEARERANVETRERAARAEAEAQLKFERAAVQRAAAEARERAAAEAQARAAAASRPITSQHKHEDDLESFFSTGGRPSSAPKARANSSNPFFESQSRSSQAAEAARRTNVGTSTGITRASSTTNIVDDLSSIFGEATPPSGQFKDVEGENEDRRRARLERQQRTQERAAKAVADKNQRDLQSQREQEERHRIAETLDVEIKRWAAGKHGNLRALLSTLQYVLWPECGWQPVSLTDLITGASVKKAYRKATLCIHPDKVQQKGANLQQKYIAEKVFDLLKEAWNKFNSEELF